MTKIETRLFLNGEFVHSTGKETFILLNPATETPVAEIEIANKQDVDLAVKHAKAACDAWANVSGATRAASLFKLADLVEKHADKLKELDSISMGKPLSVQWIDVGETAQSLRFNASLAQSLVGESSLMSPGQLNLVLRQPFGVTAAIVPWNFPLLMWVSKIGPAVAAGNACILKTSEKSPLSGLYLAGLTVEAGFPPGIIQVLSGKGDTGKILAEHMEIRKISFTGSTRTGRLVAEAAIKSNLKVCSLELGGKVSSLLPEAQPRALIADFIHSWQSPTIIFDDADIEQAVAACSFSISFNSGQMCIANSRLYVHDAIAAEFMTKFKAAFGTFKHGDPLDMSTTLGPQADDIQGKTVLDYIEAGKKEGKLVMGGERVGSKGYFVTPTVFTDVPDNAKVNKEEIFGPVVVIHTFHDEAEAIRRANDSEYGLYGAVFTKNIDRAIRVAKALEAGTVAVNASSPTGGQELPFGGYKASGQSREQGLESLKRWTEEKSVVIKYA